MSGQDFFNLCFRIIQFCKNDYNSNHRKNICQQKFEIVTLANTRHNSCQRWWGHKNDDDFFFPFRNCYWKTLNYAICKKISSYPIDKYTLLTKTFYYFLALTKICCTQESTARESCSLCPPTTWWWEGWKAQEPTSKKQSATDQVSQVGKSGPQPHPTNLR